jgi:hypothetical protein
MGGGWGGNGISSSYMAGFNGGYTWKNRSEIVGNAMFNGNERYVEEKTARQTFQKDGSTLYADDDGFTAVVKKKVKPEGAKRPKMVDEDLRLAYGEAKEAKAVIKF